EYYEMPTAWQGVNPEHLKHLRGDPAPAFRPNLARLEDFSEVQQMAPAEYREAWAWTHLMLRSRPEAKQVLVGYLRDLRTNSKPGPLRPRLAAVYPALDAALDHHLAQLQASKVHATAQR